jgi:hypothetical protein
LDDYFSALPHRLHGRGNGASLRSHALDVRDVEALSAKVLYIALFVTKPAFSQKIEPRIPKLGLGQIALSNREIEFSQVAAIQVPDKIGRTELEYLVHLQHGCPLPTANHPADQGNGSLPLQTSSSVSPPTFPSTADRSRSGGRIRWNS